MDSMPSKGTIYKKIFSRDFSLSVIQIWWRGETIYDKKWTKKSQPYFPYIVFEKVHGTINCFYDPRGIAWIKKLLFQNIKDDRGFIKIIEKNFKKSAKVVSKYPPDSTLSRSELGLFVKALEDVWVWFEAFWWLWDTNPEDNLHINLPKSFSLLREQTQDFVPQSEKIIINSLKKMYPQLGEYVRVLKVEEALSDKIPNISVLKKREKGYFFTGNRLFVGFSRSDISKKYSIKFDRPKVNSRKNLTGQSAYAGIVKGKAKIVLGYKDFDKINKGDIIISTMTMPDFLGIIKKAAAIVTDEGGTLCHAAIVAREIKKPCIVGTKVATQIFQDGDMVEINANEGIVRKIN